jgi:hypothetical protein
VSRFIEQIERYTQRSSRVPGKAAAKAVSRALGHGSDIRLGLQSWCVGESGVFVVPSASGANRNAARLEGKPTRLALVVELREVVDTPRRQTPYRSGSSPESPSGSTICLSTSRSTIGLPVSTSVASWNQDKSGHFLARVRAEECRVLSP